MSDTIHPDTSCSQCGGSFGPGKHGFSHCDHHAYANGSFEVLKATRLASIKLHRQLMDADKLTAAMSVERAINAIDAELGRRGKYLDAIKATKE